MRFYCRRMVRFPNFGTFHCAVRLKGIYPASSGLAPSDANESVAITSLNHFESYFNRDGDLHDSALLLSQTELPLV